MSVIVRKEGFFALYKGLVPTLVGIAPYAALNFATYDLVKMHYYRRGAASHNGPGKGGSARPFPFFLSPRLPVQRR